MTPLTGDSLSFEHALGELERILRSLEDGTISLEESLAQYERGVGLLKNCYSQLRDAEQRILKVAGVDAEGKPVLEIFEHTATLEAAEKKPGNRTRNKRDDSTSY